MHLRVFQSTRLSLLVLGAVGLAASFCVVVIRCFLALFFLENLKLRGSLAQRPAVVLIKLHARSARSLIRSFVAVFHVDLVVRLVLHFLRSFHACEAPGPAHEAGFGVRSSLG